MPNVTPVPDTPDLMKKMVQENKQKGIVHIFQYGPITKNETTDELPDYATLKKKLVPLPSVTMVTACKLLKRCTLLCKKQRRMT